MAKFMELVQAVCLVKILCFVSKRCLFLTHLSIAPVYGTTTDSVKPDQAQQNVTSDLILYCLLAECTFET